MIKMAYPKIYLASLFSKLNALFGRGLVVTMSIIVLMAVLASAGILLFVDSSTPNTITIASGPKGSSFNNNAEKYKKILAKEGVTLNIITSEGSIDNLKKLANPKEKVDVGFVLGGEVNGANIDHLVSLGSISYQPLMIFYRGKTKKLISDFKGLRLDIGEEGSGSRNLALTLFKANGIEKNDGTVLVDIVKGDSIIALFENRIDAIFVMGDSTSSEVMRALLHSTDVHLFNFTQADAYARRNNNLNKLDIPKGALDFGKDIPSEDTYLIGPTVELIARDSLHPALTDMLLEAAREVHGTPGLFRKRGEFPVAHEHEFPISPDATRYYATGKSYLYRTFPFGIASIIARLIAVIVPIGLLLIPAIKLAPAIYRWRMESRVNKWYRVLLNLERDAFNHSSDDNKREEFLRHLNHIEHSVSKLVVPARFGNLLYALREHIDFVRCRLLSPPLAVVLESKQAEKPS
jgi:TRAP-type uncharacterized transport system substrate-binding protein